MPDPTFTSDDIAAVVNAQTEPAAASSSAEPSATSHADAAPREPSGAEPSKPQHGNGPHIPLPDHERIVDGFHKRLDDLAWAKAYRPEQVARALALAELYEQQQSARSAPTAPDLRLQTEDGTPLGEVLQPYLQHHITQALAAQKREFEERFGPIEQLASRTQLQDTLAAQIEIARGWEGFTEHVSAIADALETAARARQPLSLHEAYIKVVVPTLKANREAIRAEERKAILDELNTTSQRAKDDLNPARTPSASRKRDADKSFGELIEEEVATRSRASA